jgi:hypothetical protein
MPETSARRSAAVRDGETGAGDWSCMKKIAELTSETRRNDDAQTPF